MSGDETRSKISQRYNLSNLEARLYQSIHHKFNMTPREVLEEMKLRKQMFFERDKILEEIFGRRTFN